MEKSESIKELAIALAKAQGEMGSATKGSTNPFFKSKYADLADVINALKHPFSQNGLSYCQFPSNDGERIAVTTLLMHISGEWLSSEISFPTQKKDAQGAGSVITYARRYSLQAMAGIPSDSDDDANIAVKIGNNMANKVLGNVKPKVDKNIPDREFLEAWVNEQKKSGYGEFLKDDEKDILRGEPTYEYLISLRETLEQRSLRA